MKIDLSKYNNSSYTTGGSHIAVMIWYLINVLFFINPINPSSRLKIFLLRAFKADVGNHVVIKPRVNIKYPWNIVIGDYTWIGEAVWLDSLAKITIGRNVCISQGAYICTGNHDWADPAFGLIIKPILIEDGVWVGAKAIVLPGTNLSSHTVISAGSVISKKTEEYGIYSGNPARKIKMREVR